MHDETGQPFGPSLGTSREEQLLNEHEAWALGFNHLLTWYVITPISIISVILNCLVLWIWNSESRFYAIVFLFKTLAVLDTVYICFFNVWWYCPRDSAASTVLDGLTFGSQYMSVYASLMIVVYRWLAVYKPVLSRKLRSRSFTQLAVGIMVGWCAIVKPIELVVKYTVSDLRNYIILNVAAAQLMLHLPVLVQAALTVSLVMAMRNERMVRSTAVASGLTDNSHVATPLTETRRRHSSRDRGKLSKGRRLNYTIFCISAVSVIAYPVTVATIGYFKLTDSHYHMSVKKAVFAVSNMVHVINSGINFFFYYAFMLEFRKLLVLTCISDETTRYHTLANTSAVASQSLSRSYSHAKIHPQANIQLPHAANVSTLPPTKADGRKLMAIQEVSFDETRSLAVIRETKADGELPTALAPDREVEGGRPAEEEGGRPAEGEGGRPAEGEADDEAG